MGIIDDPSYVPPTSAVDHLREAFVRRERRRSARARRLELHEQERQHREYLTNLAWNDLTESLVKTLQPLVDEEWLDVRVSADGLLNVLVEGHVVVRGELKHGAVARGETVYNGRAEFYSAIKAQGKQQGFTSELTVFFGDEPEGYERAPKPDRPNALEHVDITEKVISMIKKALEHDD